MQISPGTMIRSTSALDGSFFEEAEILIVEHNEKGSIGFVTNKPDGRYLNQLQEFSDCPPVPLLEGGPVGQENLYLLHHRPDLIRNGTQVSGDLYWGGDMKDVSRALKENRLQGKEIKLFIGYCGWDQGELVQEIREGTWK